MPGDWGSSEEGTGLTSTGERGRAIGTRLQWETLEIEVRNYSPFSVKFRIIKASNETPSFN